jgi:hypothetical protein
MEKLAAWAEAGADDDAMLVRREKAIFGFFEDPDSSTCEEAIYVSERHPICRILCDSSKNPVRIQEESSRIQWDSISSGILTQFM